jgi:hypothetical protein
MRRAAQLGKGTLNADCLQCRVINYAVNKINSWCVKQFNDERRDENLQTKSKLVSKSTRKTKVVRIPCGYPHARCVLLCNKAGVEDLRELLGRFHDRKFALENIIS